MKSHLFKQHTVKRALKLRAVQFTVYYACCKLELAFIHVTALKFHKLKAIKVNYSVDLVEKFNEFCGGWSIMLKLHVSVETLRFD
jgi:hypothetical protein